MRRGSKCCRRISHSRTAENEATAADGVAVAARSKAQRAARAAARHGRSRCRHRSMPAVAIDTSAVLDLARTGSAELAVLDRRIEEQRAKVALAHALRVPDLVPTATLTHDAQPEFTYGWRAGVAVTLPLFTTPQGGRARRGGHAGAAHRPAAGDAAAHRRRRHGGRREPPRRSGRRTCGIATSSCRRRNRSSSSRRTPTGSARPESPRCCRRCRHLATCGCARSTPSRSSRRRSPIWSAPSERRCHDVREHRAHPRRSLSCDALSGARGCARAERGGSRERDRRPREDRRGDARHIRGVVHATGIVTPAPGAELVVVAPEAARIVEMPRAEGDRVRRGDSAGAVRDSDRGRRGPAAGGRGRARPGSDRQREGGADPRARAVRARRRRAQGSRGRQSRRGRSRGGAGPGARVARRGAGSRRAGDRSARPSTASSPGGCTIRAISSSRRRPIRCCASSIPAASRSSASIPLADALAHPGRRAGAPGARAVQRRRGSPEGHLASGRSRDRHRRPFRCAWPSPAGDIPAGTPVQVDIDAEQHRDVVLVPAVAIVREGEETAVFVAIGDEGASAARCDVGLTTARRSRFSRASRPARWSSSTARPACRTARRSRWAAGTADDGEPRRRARRGRAK